MRKLGILALVCLFALVLGWPHGGVRAQTSGHSVTLTWTPSGPSSDTFNVYRSGTSTGQQVKLNASPLATASYVDSAVTAASGYCYQVTELNSGGESGESNQVCVSIPAPPPPVPPNPPTGLKAVVQ